MNYRQSPRYEIQDMFEKNFLPYKIYLWTHLMGYREDVRSSRKRIFYKIIAIVFILFGIANNLFLVTAFYSLNNRIMGRSEYFQFLILISNAFLRILTYTSTKSVQVIVGSLTRIYSTVTQERGLKFKKNLCLILVTCDASVMIYALIMAIVNIDENFKKSVEYGIPKWVMHVSYFLMQWTHLCPATSILFSALCYAIKQTLTTLEKKLSGTVGEAVDDLYYVYSDIIKLIKTFNDEYQLVLFMEILVVLSTSFRELYNIVFIYTRNESVRSLCLILTFLRLVSVCMFASSVTDAASRVKDALSFKAMEEQRSKIFHTLLIIKDKSVSFTLLRSITVDSGLILTTVGHIMTYGMLIATFNVSQK